MSVLKLSLVRVSVVVLVASCILFAMPAAVSADLGGFEIVEYHSDLTVQPNSDLIVEELIDVDFFEPRRGIYRTVPVRYTDPKGYSYSVDFDLIGVEDGDGRDVTTKVTHDGPYVRLRFGDSDKYIEGRQQYLIRYRVGNAVKGFDEHDEIYWNNVGDEWQTYVHDASATVHLPDQISPDEIRAVAYTGYAGSQSQHADVSVVGPSLVKASSTESLGPRQGMTVAVAWPKGHVSFPGPLSRLIGLVLDNWIVVAPLLALGFVYRRYRKHGRDPEVEAAVMVQYEAPEGLTAAEIGTLIDEKVDLRDISATVVDLAIRGYIVVTSEEKKGLFGSSTEVAFERRYPPGAPDLLEHEELVMEGLFTSGGHVTSDDLREEFYVHLPAIKSALYGRLAENNYFVEDPDSVRTRWMVYGFLAGAAVFAIGALWAWLRGGVIPIAFILPAISGAMVALIFVAFSAAMPRRTDAGVSMRNWALGFEEFVHRVESDRIARDEQQGVFEKLLPVAMALGVAAVWARKFEGIYDTAPPPWYVGPMPHGVFSTVGMEKSMSSAMSDVQTAMAATPRSSGSSGFGGGGGFSGGGFGGGGGGSW